jgi:hypothetical protein
MWTYYESFLGITKDKKKHRISNEIYSILKNEYLRTGKYDLENPIIYIIISYIRRKAKFGGIKPYKMLKLSRINFPWTNIELDEHGRKELRELLLCNEEYIDDL